jgi:hypothetical protein
MVDLDDKYQFFSLLSSSAPPYHEHEYSMKTYGFSLFFSYIIRVFMNTFSGPIFMREHEFSVKTQFSKFIPET